jgi:hypothetical protein
MSSSASNDLRSPMIDSHDQSGYTLLPFLLPVNLPSSRNSEGERHLRRHSYHAKRIHDRIGFFHEYNVDIMHIGVHRNVILCEIVVHDASNAANSGRSRWNQKWCAVSLNNNLATQDSGQHSIWATLCATVLGIDNWRDPILKSTSCARRESNSEFGFRNSA